MRDGRKWADLVRGAFAGAAHIPDDDVIEELAQHASAMYETARADGWSDLEAERRVADQLDRWRIRARELRHPSRRPPIVEPPPAVARSHFSGIVQDVRYGARLLRRQPRYTLPMVLTMALGIGATTVLFSVAYGVLMKPLPWPHSHRVVALKETRGGNAPRFGAFTNAAYLAWREEATTIDGIAAWSQRLATLSGAGEPERIRITVATASLFPVLGVRPLLGSVFDENGEASPLIVLSEGLWRQRFGARADALGRIVEVDGRPHTIVGVLPDRVGFPDPQTRAVVSYSVPTAAGNQLSMFSAIALLRPGVTPAQASAEATTRGRLAADTGLTTMAIFGSNGPMQIAAQPLRDAVTDAIRQPIIGLLVAVGLLLMTATANCAGLQFARTIARSREMAIRAALGAGSARVTRQLFVEGVLLGAIGGAAGLTLTWLLHATMPALLPADFPRVDALGVDAVVVCFALLVSIGTSIAIGLLPARSVHRLNLVQVLVQDGTALAGVGARSPAARARTLIMAGQVAIACVLLVGASLLGRSFLALLNADRGYDPKGVLSARLSMPATMYPAPERRFAIVEQILHRLAAIPGVSEAAFTSELPLTPGGSTAAFTLRSRDRDGGLVNVQASPRVVSPRYFPALAMRMISGRSFSDQDAETSEPVVVVNQAFARRYLGTSPLAAKLPMAGYGPAEGDPVETTVIGVVDEVRYVTAGDVAHPELYYSHRQMQGRLPVQTVTLLARTYGDPGAAAGALRMVIREADARLAVDAVMPLEQRLLTTIAQPRLYAVLVGGFAAFALVIAAVGLFGLLSYIVSQRSRELAVRAALGAGRSDILRLILRHGLAVILTGLVVGIGASMWMTRLLSTQLYGVTPHDTFTFVVVPLVVLLCGALACLIPAGRAARVDPSRVLSGG